jgi:zinc protease
MKYIKQLFIIAFCICTSLANSYAQGYTLPKYEKFTLPNGLTVYLAEQKDVPIISLSAIFPAGAIYDGDKAGLASLTATALLSTAQNLLQK